MKLILHDDEATNRKWQIRSSVVAVLVAVAMFGTWLVGVYDPYNSTEAEVVEIHNTEMDKVNYAKQSAISHIANMMVDEQVGDAAAEKEELEDLVDTEEGTPADERKITRLGESIKKYKKGCIEEPGADHTHEGCH